MYDDSLNLKKPAKVFAKKFTKDKHKIECKLKFEGQNREIIDSYYWIFNFAYYTGKGFTTFKLEDYHYFSENNQFGAQMRQIKGGSVRAFQENLQQMIQLVKNHLFPLLKEVKQADFYRRWFDKISVNDDLIRKEQAKSNPNKNDIEKWAKERDEAISHLKDKWVSEVDGGRLWTINKPASEQGLDFSLLPQLFFGTSLDDPLCKKKSLKEQLDNYIYKVDISEGAKEVAARFLYRFHTWLPGAISDTQVSYKIKVSSLKQFYAQLQMYIEFMRPLLMEIHKKKEGYDKTNFYHGHEHEDPIFANMLDVSYSFIRTLGVCGFERGGFKFDDIEFTRFGLYISNGKAIWHGRAKDKKGFVVSEEKDNYTFVESDKKEISFEDFKKLYEDKSKRYDISKKDLMLFSVMEFEFSQKRRNEVKKTPQGMANIPFIQNQIMFRGFAWNIVEVATHRESLKANDLDILETFIAEIGVVKDDLLNYVGGFEDDGDVFNYMSEQIKKNSSNKSSSSSSSKKSSENLDFAKEMTLNPFKGLYEMLEALFSGVFTFGPWGNSDEKPKAHPMEEKILEMQLKCLEDTWKVYSVHKKANQFMQY